GGAIENQRALPFMRRPLDDARVELAQVRIEVIQALSHLVMWKSGNLEIWEFGNVGIWKCESRITRLPGPRPRPRRNPWPSIGNCRSGRTAVLPATDRSSSASGRSRRRGQGRGG